MTRYMSTQYPNKNPGHQPNGRTEDKNGKKGDDLKPEDKDNNATGTVGAHVGDVTTPEDSTAPSSEFSIGTQVSEVTKRLSWPTQSIEDLLEAYFIDDAIWGGTNPCDMSVDTANSKEVMAGSHTMEGQKFTLCRSDQHEVINVKAHKPRKDDLFWDYDLDFLDNYYDWNESTKVTDTTNSGANITGANFTNQEHQNYGDQQAKQYIACKYNRGLEQVTLELAPDIILEEEYGF